MSRENEIGVTSGGIAPLPPPAPGLVRFRAADNAALGLIAELDGPVLPGGYAQWSQVDRPHKLPLTDFAGLAPLTLPIPLLFDRWSAGRSVEPEIKMLETMLGRHGVATPPAVIIEGPGIPFSFERDQSLRFVLSEPSWGDEPRTTGMSGERSYVRVTVTATQFTPATLVESSDKTRRYYKVTKKNPNTLREIAKRYRLSRTQIVALNTGRKGIPRDPDHTIRAGVKVRIA